MPSDDDPDAQEFRALCGQIRDIKYTIKTKLCRSLGNISVLDEAEVKAKCRKKFLKQIICKSLYILIFFLITVIVFNYGKLVGSEFMCYHFGGLTNCLNPSNIFGYQTKNEEVAF